MKYKEIEKVITKKVSFHDVEDYPSILEASYLNGDVERRWFISREGYLAVKDYAEAMDIDFWIKTKKYIVIDSDQKTGRHKIIKPNYQEKVYLVSQSFLDDPRRFWESFNDNVFDVSSKIKSKDLIPIHIYDETYSIFDLDGKIMRLPMIVTFYDDIYDLEALVEHIKKYKKYKEVIDVKVINGILTSKAELSLDTNLLPIQKTS